MKLLLLFLTCFYLLASLSDCLQEHNMEAKGIPGCEIGGFNCNKDYGQNGNSVHSSKYVNAFGQAQQSGSSGTADDGSAANKGTRGYGRGNSAVVHFLLRGPQNNNHHSPSPHGAASSNRNCLVFHTLITITLASLFVHLKM